MLWRDALEINALNADGDESFMLSFPEIPKSLKLPWWQLSLAWRNYKKGEPGFESFRKGVLDNMTSWGIVYKTFEGLEGFGQWAHYYPTDMARRVAQDVVDRVQCHQMIRSCGWPKSVTTRLGVGGRVCVGGPESVPDSVELARLLDESLKVGTPERVKVKELSRAATNAVKEGASSRDLNTFVKLLSEL
ncbi:uncharacterized protein LOC143599012 [Bidens hawaiensis]|uniref:uncharacterized protein LOC143599012 n=1 Tax=Bidens hawaiensis TaxID=980011 RepID=UPI004049BAC5